ncbi:hypothetical protein [Streptomyces nigra]|uniref:hypothetical protein n=1 Tax=Streptomyces nigra TaxID=1827580 RepID=UPI003641EF65
MTEQQPHQDHGHHHHSDHEREHEQHHCTATGTVEPDTDACCAGETDSGGTEAAQTARTNTCASDGCCE